MKNKKVQVLLSTYNGEKYLEELLDSIINQTYKRVEILIRDDGSKDHTIDILKKYQEKKNINVVFGENVGVPESFFELLELSSDDYDYFAFADQDDFWKKNKISRAVELLNDIDNKDIPGLYFSRKTLTNKNLKKIKNSKKLPKEPSFNNALVQNVATGCTMVFNNNLRDILIEKKPIISNIRMHDWWVYQVGSAFGEIKYDSKSTILYRQHDSNVVGTEVNLMKKWIKRIKRYIKSGNSLLIRKQIKEFYKLYNQDLSQEKKQLLEEFKKDKNLFERIKFIISSKVYRQSKTDDVILKILILLDKI